MIKTLRHRGLRRLYEKADPSQVRPDLVQRIEDILAHLDQAAKLSDLNLPGYRLHQLKGDRAGTWSISVSGNWRVTFRFQQGDVYDVSLEDYH